MQLTELSSLFIQNIAKCSKFQPAAIFQRIDLINGLLHEILYQRLIQQQNH